MTACDMIRLSTINGRAFSRTKGHDISAGVILQRSLVHWETINHILIPVNSRYK